MRAALELKYAFRVINHGPSTLVSSAYGDQRNVMAAAWVMPLSFDPPLIAVVIDSSTHTRTLVEASGQFALNIPTAKMANLVWSVGCVSGAKTDKFSEYQIPSTLGSKISVPLIDGCAAWLECQLVSEPELQAKYDLFVGQIVAASVEDNSWKNGRWDFGADDDRTIHHLSKGLFYTTGHEIQGKQLPGMVSVVSQLAKKTIAEKP